MSKKTQQFIGLFTIIFASVFIFFIDEDPKETPEKTEELAPVEPIVVEEEEKAVSASVTDLADLEIPNMAGKHQTIRYEGFTVSYNEAHEQANWVAYELTAEEVAGTQKRKDDFRADPKVAAGSATKADYKGSGYDRGHLAPAADMKWSKNVMSESFYFTNMSPQVPSFNRGIWKKLEEQVREWAKENGAVYVVTGGILEEGLPTIGENEVSVPKYYYKVILDHQEPDIKAIAFLMENKKLKGELAEYAVSIDSIENVTGIDFFALLDDSQEETLEGKAFVQSWTW